jgi:hypothetical protein
MPQPKYHEKATVNSRTPENSHWSAAETGIFGGKLGDL